MARIGEEGENVQGMPEWRDWRHLPLTVIVPRLGPSQATVSWWKKSASVMVFKGRASPSRRPLFWPQHAVILPFSTISAQCGVPDLVYDSLLLV